MSRRFLPPRRFYTQPQGAVEVDRDHPLTQQLKLLLNTASGPRELVAGQMFVPINGASASGSPSPRGMFLAGYANSGPSAWIGPDRTSGGITAKAYQPVAPPATFFGVGWEPGGGTEYRAALINRSNGSGQPAWSVGWRNGNSNRGLRARIALSGGHLTIESSGVAYEVRGKVCVSVLVVGPTTTTAYLGEIGRPPEISSSAGTPSGNFYYEYDSGETRTVTYAGARSDDANALTAGVAWRAWSEAEVIEYFLNPWQLFRAPTNRIYSIPAAAATTTKVIPVRGGRLTRQPQTGPLEVADEWGRGLIAAGVGNGLSTDGVVMTPEGGASFQTRQAGVAMRTVASAGYQFSSGDQKFPAMDFPVTVFWYGYVHNWDGQAGYLMSYEDGNFGNQGWRFSHGYYGPTLSFYKNGTYRRSTTNTPISGIGSPAVRCFAFSYWASTNYNAGVAYAADSGKAINLAFDAGGTWTGFNHQPSNIIIGRSSGIETWAWGIWNAGYSLADLLKLTSAPWQLFRAPTRYRRVSGTIIPGEYSIAGDTSGEGETSGSIGHPPTYPLAGATSGEGTTAGAISLVASYSLAGETIGVGATAGAISVPATYALAGETFGVGATAGAIGVQAAYSLAGDTSGVGATTGAISLAAVYSLAGDTSGVGETAGAISLLVAHVLAGDTLGVGATAGGINLAATYDLAGPTAGEGVTSGGITHIVVHTLEGETSGVGLTAGAIGVVQTHSIEGDTSGEGATQGAITVFGAGTIPFIEVWIWKRIS